MARRNHFVVDKFLPGAQMTLEAFLGAMNNIAGIAHSQRERFFFRPIPRGVRAEPGGSGPVAIFAGDAFRQFERPAALLWSRVKGVAREAFWSFFRFRTQFQDARHAFADIPGQRLVRTAVLVPGNPSGVFVLQNSAAFDGRDATVTAGGRARTWADIFLRLRGIAGRGGRRSGSRRLAILRGSRANRENEGQGQREAQRGAQPMGMKVNSHARLRTSDSPHYRVEHNRAALSFSRRGAKRQRPSIYTMKCRQ